MAMQSPQTLLEKEYIFDETLGESLQDHVQGIKEAYNDQFEVLVRRDRDGYAIVKTKFKPKYKYNIDDVANMDPASDQVKIKESLEDILKIAMSGEEGQSILSMDKQQLEQKLITSMNSLSEVNYDLDQGSKKVLKDLLRERFNGKYANDREGFAEAIMNTLKNASFDKNKVIKNLTSSAEAYQEIEKDRDLMISEITEQVILRMKEHMFQKKRTEKDFLQPRVSENTLFDSQVLTNTIGIENLEKEIQNAPSENEPAFDKEAYLAIKSEIKRRREAKEKLLNQGFPELKPYLNF